MNSENGTPNLGDGAGASHGPTGANGQSIGEAPAASIHAALAEFLAQATTYFAAKRDLLELRMRSLAIALVIGCLALIAAISLVATAAVLLVVGVAGGLAAAFEIPLWAGQLITSLTAGVIGILVLYTALIYLRYISLQRTIARYERRRQPHRADRQRAHSPANVATG